MGLQLHNKAWARLACWCAKTPPQIGTRHITYLLTYMAWVRAQAPRKGAKHGYYIPAFL